MMLRRFLKFKSQFQKHIPVYCDGYKYIPRRDGGKELDNFEIRDNSIYMYTKQNKNGYNYYTVCIIYQFHTINSTKKRKTVNFDYICDDVSLARARARFKLSQKPKMMEHKYIYSYDVEIRLYKDKTNYVKIPFKRADIDEENDRIIFE
jgi:hypothetical protein